MGDALDRLNEQNETALLQFVVNNHVPKLCRVYQQVKIPFTVSNYINLCRNWLRESIASLEYKAAITQKLIYC